MIVYACVRSKIPKNNGACNNNVYYNIFDDRFESVRVKQSRSKQNIYIYIYIGASLFVVVLRFSVSFFFLCIHVYIYLFIYTRVRNILKLGRACNASSQISLRRRRRNAHLPFVLSLPVIWRNNIATTPFIVCVCVCVCYVCGDNRTHAYYVIIIIIL